MHTSDVITMGGRVLRLSTGSLGNAKWFAIHVLCGCEVMNPVLVII